MASEGNNGFKMKLNAVVEHVVDELKKSVKELDPEKFVNEFDLQSIPDDDLVEALKKFLESNLFASGTVRVPLENCLKSYLEKTIKTFQNHINKE